MRGRCEGHGMHLPVVSGDTGWHQGGRPTPVRTQETRYTLDFHGPKRQCKATEATILLYKKHTCDSTIGHHPSRA
eukprot:scaffold133_cov407-Prasinococcus_capsulatus_cf.AAC.4